MAKTKILTLKGAESKDITLNDEIWNIEINEVVMSDAIRLQLASLRQGTHKTKDRSEVSGGGRKPWRQKGTGHARQGSTRAPQWVGGGTVFGPQPRTYFKKMNRKERRLALRSALSYKTQDQELIVLDNLNLETNKTKDMLKVLEAIKANKNILIVVEELTENVILSTRNIPNVVLLQANEINTLDIVASDNLVITKEAVKQIEEVLA